MKADFLDAHKRHWDDAEHLFGVQRLANADHLYGMAAECGLKRLMQVFDMPCRPEDERPKEQSDRVHADGIWDRFESYRNGHQQGVGYALPAGNPFSNWHVADRYAQQADFNQERVQAHQEGAQLVFNLIEKARREGLL